MYIILIWIRTSFIKLDINPFLRNLYAWWKPWLIGLKSYILSTDLLQFLYTNYFVIIIIIIINSIIIIIINSTISYLWFNPY